MAEYIEREALLEDIENTLVFSGRPDRQNPKQVGARLVVQRVRCAPAADVAPVVHAKWVQVICHVEFEDGFVDRLYECCSRCHEPNGRKTSDYCPNCGCRMDGGNE